MLVENKLLIDVPGDVGLNETRKYLIRKNIIKTLLKEVSAKKQ